LTEINARARDCVYAVAPPVDCSLCSYADGRTDAAWSGEHSRMNPKSWRRQKGYQQSTDSPGDTTLQSACCGPNKANCDSRSLFLKALPPARICFDMCWNGELVSAHPFPDLCILFTNISSSIMKLSHIFKESIVYLINVSGGREPLEKIGPEFKLSAEMIATEIDFLKENFEVKHDMCSCGNLMIS
jgi:hypothetical protein